MRVILADVKSSRGFVSKDTVVGGYGSRLDPFTRVTKVMAYLKGQFHDVPSVHMAYMAAILARAGHDVKWTRGDMMDGDVALVLSSLVDYKNETAWADAMRARGVKVGFVGITASKLPQLFADHCDFILTGEPESAVMRLAQGEIPRGNVISEQINDLDSLPFPRWDLVTERRMTFGSHWFTRPVGGGFPLLASRGCPEFCTYCPHRILAGYRARSVANIIDEMERLCDQYRRPYVIFRDPLFTEQRERMLELCDGIQSRGLTLTFEAETRLDRLDAQMLDKLHAAGFRAMSFGVESLSPETLKKSGRRPIPEAHQRAVLEHCRKLGIVTAAFYVLGFLQDDWNSIAATIDYATDIGSTFAQFKILTPYPGTPMFKQLEPLLTETDWEQFDGYTPTFRHPNLSGRELRYLLGAAYKRFYMRPSYLANFLKIQNAGVREWVTRMDQRVNERHNREEIADISRRCMLTAISRYGARVLDNTEEIAAGCKARGEFIQGPDIARFETAFAARLGQPYAIAASYGRMAFYYILKALDLPAGSEIVLPTLTFWVVPELAKVAGLKVVFADVDPVTFTMDPGALERAITPATRAVVPTHLYGLPCDMDAIMAIASRHDLHVIEDCAHALGATFAGRPVGTFGDAGFFSFQTLKPLNCYGGGMAIVRNEAVAKTVRNLAERESWPDQKRIENRLLVGRLQRIFIKPWVFSISAFPILWVSSLIGANPDVYLWEEIRSLNPLPDAYTERFPNVQAAIGLAALDQLDRWTEDTRRHARAMDNALGDLPGVSVPYVPPGRTHVYYQYGVYGQERDELVVRCVRRGIDIETLHVDVCSDLDLFDGARVEPAGAPGAHRAAGAIQVPVYSTLTDAQAARVARVVRGVLTKA